MNDAARLLRMQAELRDSDHDACPVCMIWVCPDCHARRVTRNREVAACPHCGSTAGRLEPSYHSRSSEIWLMHHGRDDHQRR